MYDKQERREGGETPANWIWLGTNWFLRQTIPTSGFHQDQPKTFVYPYGIHILALYLQFSVNFLCKL